MLSINRSARQLLGPLAAVFALAYIGACYPCSPIDRYRLTDVTVRSMDTKIVHGEELRFATSKLRNAIIFEVDAKFERLSRREWRAMSMDTGSSVVTYDCLDDEVVNQPNELLSRIIFDKDVEYRGQTIAAGENLLYAEGSYHPREGVQMSSLYVHYDQDTMIYSDFEIPPDDYQVTLEWYRGDDLVHSQTLDVHIDVDLSNTKNSGSEDENEDEGEDEDEDEGEGEDDTGDRGNANSESAPMPAEG